MKFSALNKEASNSGATPARKSSKPTKEAQVQASLKPTYYTSYIWTYYILIFQESACLQLYRTALKCQQDGKLEEAKSLYQEILDSEVLQEVSQGHAQGASVETSPVLKVKYLTYKNIATIAREQGDFSAALEAYIQASSIDGSEVVLWCQMASSAVSLGNLLLARKAFEQALRRNEGYWPAIEGLSGVLFALDDYRACLLLLVKVLNTESEFPRGIAYVHSINEKHPELISTLPDLQMWAEADLSRNYLLTLLSHLQCWLSGAIPPGNLPTVPADSIITESVPMDTSAGCLTPIKTGPSIKEGSQLPLEDAGSGEEVGRRDLKRKALDMESYLAPKRRSMRVKSKQQEPTARFSGLQKYIPHCLRQCEMAELSDLSPLKKPPSDIDESVKNADKQNVVLLLEKTKQLPEPETVLQFIEQHKTNRVFIEVYKVLHKHLMYPSPFCLDEEEGKTYAQQLAEIALCYVELSIDAMVTGQEALSVRKEPLSSSDISQKCFHDCIGFVQLCGSQILGDEIKVFSIRVSWALARWRMLQGDNAAAALALKKCHQDLEAYRGAVGNGGAVYLCNQHGDQVISSGHILRYCMGTRSYPQVLHGDQVISSAHVAGKLKLIEQSVSLDQVTQMFNKKEYLEVVKQLSPVLVQEAGSITEFLIGSEKSGEDTGLSIFLRSLINLGRIKECVECCIQALHALLVDYRIGNEHWIEALRFIFVTLEKHLDAPLLGELEVKAVKQLMLCVLKTIDVTCDITEPMLLLLMPICIPWKIFYVIISSNWQGKTEGEKKRSEEEGVGVATDTQYLQSHMQGSTKAVEKMESVECLTPLGSSALLVVMAPTGTADQPNNYQPIAMHQAVTTDTTTVNHSLTIAMVAPPTELATDTTQEAAKLPSSLGHIKSLDSVPGVSAVVSAATKVSSDITTPTSVMINASPLTATVTTTMALATPPTSAFVLASLSACPLVAEAQISLQQSDHGENSCAPTESSECPLGSSAIYFEPTSVPLVTPAVSFEPSTVPCGPTAVPCVAPAVGPSAVPCGPTAVPCVAPAVGPSAVPCGPTAVPCVAPAVGPSAVPCVPSAVPCVPSAVPCVPSAVPCVPSAVPCGPSAVPYGPSASAVGPSASAIGPSAVSTTDTCKNSSSSDHFVHSSSEKHEELKLHLQFLKEAHGYLGSLGWCCRDDGCFLQASVDTLRGELQVLSALPPKHRDILLQELEQCYYCLYGYPQKKAKARGLAEHNAEQVPLTWTGALKLTEYFHCPYSSFSEVKNTYITAELLVLYKRITDVMPQEGKAHVFNALTDYIDGKVDNTPPPVSAQPHNSLIAEIFHILGDDSLKSQDNLKAIHYYQNSLCYVPEHLEAWTGLALSYSEKIYKQLDMRDSKASLEKFLQKHVQQTVRCFEKAVALNAQSSFVLEKFGFFCYTIQSFVSQIVQLRDLFPSDHTLQWATSMRSKMLAEAEKCFLQATKLEKSWSSSLMLGKISYKLIRPTSATLEHFANAACCCIDKELCTLCCCGARLQRKAMEAIEAHYQLHACALKVLMQSKGNEMEEVVREALSKVAHLPLSAATYPRVWEWVGQLSRGGASLPPSKGKTEGGEDKMEVLGQDLDVESVMESSDTGVGGGGDGGGDLAMEFSDTGPTISCLAFSTTPPSEKAPIGSVPQCAVPLAQGTERVPQCAVPLAQGTERVPQCAVPLVQGTERVPQSVVPLVQGTERVPQCASLPSPVAIESTTIHIPHPPTSLPACLFDNTNSMSSAMVTPETSSSCEYVIAPLELTPFSSAFSQSPVEETFSESRPPTGEILPEPLITETGSVLLYKNITLGTATPLLGTSQLPQSSALSSVPQPPVGETTPPLMESVLPDTVAHTRSDGLTTHSFASPSSLCATSHTHSSPPPSIPHSTPPSSVTTGKGEPSVLSLTPEGGGAVAMVQESRTAGHGGSAVSSSSPATPLHHHLCASLLEQCLYHVAVCAVRCPAYFKPLNRLALALDKMGLAEVAQQLLLGPIPSQLLEIQEKLAPLFVLRSNIFTNQWQIPVEEINRPGTFSTHARKNLELLVAILVRLGETSTLAYLCAQLKARPDATKQYLRDNERVAMFKKVWGMCLSTLKATYDKEVCTASTEKLGNLLMEVYNLRTVALRVDSQHYTKSSDAVLQSVYTSLLAAEAKEAGNEGNPPSPSLEEATKYCQARLKRAQAAADVAIATHQSTCVSSTAN
eukprot:Em0009g1291a